MAEDKNEQTPAEQPADGGAINDMPAESGEAVADVAADEVTTEVAEGAEAAEEQVAEAPVEADEALADEAAEAADATEAAEPVLASEAAEHPEPPVDRASAAVETPSDEADAPAQKESQGIGHLVAVGIIALILGILLSLPTFLASQEAGANSDYDVSGGVAAQVGDVQIGENDITNEINKIRATQGLADDDEWGKMLVSSGMTAEVARSSIIEQVVANELVNQAAAENDVEVTDEAIEEEYEKVKKQYGSGNEFEEMLSQWGMSIDDVKTDLKRSLLRTELGKKVVTDVPAISDADLLAVLKVYHPDAVAEDAETLEGVDESIVAEIRESLESYERDSKLTEWLNTYREGKNVTINDMPEGLPYDIDLEPYQDQANVMDGMMMDAEDGAEVAEDAGEETEEIELEDDAVDTVEVEEESDASASSASASAASASASSASK